MFLLEKDSYGKVEPMFKNMFDYETTVRLVFKDNNAPCDMYVDDLINPKSSFFVMNWGGYRPCYFGGKYNEQFVYSCLCHIFTEQAARPIYADSELLKEIDKNFFDNRDPNIRQMYKNYPDNHEHWHSKRLYYKLNKENFLRKKLSLLELPENYELVLYTEKENEKVMLMYNGKEAGNCGGCYNSAVEEINLDVFLEEEHRDKSIGPVVCAKLIEYHLSQNHGYITWGCDEFNVRSAKCTEKLGFELLCEKEIIFG